MKNKVRQVSLLLLIALALCVVSIPQNAHAQISAAVKQTYSLTEWNQMQAELLSLQHQLTNTSLTPAEIGKLNTKIAELQAKINQADVSLTSQHINHPVAKEASVSVDNSTHITGPVDFSNPYGNIPSYVSTGNSEQDNRLIMEWLISKGLIKQ